MDRYVDAADREWVEQKLRHMGELIGTTIAENAEVTDKKQHRTERFYGKFERSFTLPENVLDGGIKANMDGGMLYIHLAKADFPRKAMKHEIKVS